MSFAIRAAELSFRRLERPWRYCAERCSCVMRGSRTAVDVDQHRRLEAALIYGLLTDEKWTCSEPLFAESEHVRRT